ncbi:MAG: hypothetical protein JST87_16730 [Bacteroidetes bacterium]|nr:hypothetical protein [Bacteroidota bacterium]
MEIHFIWIHKFAHFKNQGINLSSKYFIKLELDKNNENNNEGRLIIKYNPNYIDDFFGKPNIVNVTGIIGKNGTGKSSILNYIKSYLPEGLEANIESDIIVYSYENANESHHCIMVPQNWNLQVIDDTGKFIINNYGQSTNVMQSFRLSSKLSEIDYVYYSFFIDYKPELTDWAGLKNISTSALIEQERKKRVEENLSLPNNQDTQNFSSDLEYFIGNEITKAVQFLISSSRSILPFSPPNTLNISIDNTDRIFFSKTNTTEKDVHDLITRLDNKNKKEKANDRPLNSMLIALLINLLLTERKFSSSIKFSHDFSIKKKESLKKFITRFFVNLRNNEVNYGNTTIPYSKYLELSELVPKFITQFENLLNQKIISVQNSNEKQPNFVFHLSDKADQAFSALITIYLKIKGLTPFLSFKWRGLSTGEQSYLSFVSRFYHLKHHEIGSADLKKNLVILIDEGDAGYHPEWQRKFFKNTIEFLSLLFSEHKLQLIITANAPFLTSDLPKYHIIFIEKTSDEQVIVHEKENNRAETFGGNIHTLFSDSFYMDGAIIGAFAKEKIDSIIKYLGNDQITQPDQAYKKTINLIGEPILRRKLQGMWSDKFGIDDEIENLRNRIDTLLKLKRKK